MKKLCFIILLTVTVSNYGQVNFLNFISYLNSIQDSARKVAVADSFYNAKKVTGIPTIEGNSAIFLYRGTAGVIQLSGDFNDWTTNSYMTKVSKTNFFYFAKSFELDARIDYKLVVDGNWIIDPANNRVCPGGYGPNSELAMPNYVQPWEITYGANTKRGSVVSATIHSTIVNANYQLNIYLPYGYSGNSNRYPVAYFHDGTDYTSLASAITVCDNVIDSNITAPFIAVFVKPNDRNSEYAGALRNLYHRFFATELVHYIDSLYRTIPNREARLTIGDSFGGNISALIVNYHPEVFKNCGLQSGAFWPNNFEAHYLLTSSAYKDLKFYADWGTYESLYLDMRSFRDTMKLKQYPFEWIEMHEGHSWGQWRATLRPLLKYFYPAQPVGNIESEVKPSIARIGNIYPNPVNLSESHYISIPISNINSASLKVSVYTILGAFVSDVYPEVISNSGAITIPIKQLSAGVYICKIANGNIVETKKFVVIK